MRPTDREEFGDVMRDAYQAIGQGQPYTEGGLDLMFAALMEFDLGTLQQALIDHINSTDGKWRPNASYIRTQITRRTSVQWMAADEAWLQIPKDERTPGLLNQVTAQALAAVAPMLAEGETNAARMGFRATYERLVEQEKVKGNTPKYFVSPAGSMEAQADVAAEGVRLGLLPPSAAPDVALLSGPTPKGQAQVKQILAMLALPAMPKNEGVDDE